MDINTIITIAGVLVSIGVSYGIITTQIAGIQKEVSTVEEKLKACPLRSECDLKHTYIERDMREIKETLREIKEMIKEISDK